MAESEGAMESRGIEATVYAAQGMMSDADADADGD